MLSSQIAGMLGKRDQWIRALDGKQLDLLREEIDAALIDCIGDRLRHLSELWPKHISGCPDARIDDLERWRQAATRMLPVERKSRGLLTRRPLAGIRNSVQPWCAVRNLGPWLSQMSSGTSFRISSRRCRSALACWKPFFASEDEVDFTRITQAAVEALGTPERPSDLAYRLDYRIEHLLVDEFQDTSLVQYELLDRLTGSGLPGMDVLCSSSATRCNPFIGSAMPRSACFFGPAGEDWGV